MLDRNPLHCRLRSQTPTLALGQFRCASLSNVLTFGTWEENGVPGKTHVQTWGKCTNATQEYSIPGWELIFSHINIIKPRWLKWVIQGPAVFHFWFGKANLIERNCLTSCKWPNQDFKICLVLFLIYTVSPLVPISLLLPALVNCEDCLGTPVDLFCTCVWSYPNSEL